MIQNENHGSGDFLAIPEKRSPKAPPKKLAEDTTIFLGNPSTLPLEKSASNTEPFNPVIEEITPLAAKTPQFDLQKSQNFEERVKQLSIVKEDQNDQVVIEEELKVGSSVGGGAE